MTPNPIQWALDPAGPQAARIASLYWVFFWVSAVAYVITIGFLVLSVVKSRRNVVADSSMPREQSLARGVTIGGVLTIVALFGLLIASVATGSAVGTFAQNTQNQLEVQVTGHQWWWEITYPDPTDSSKMIRTANEIHIPVGKPILGAEPSWQTRSHPGARQQTMDPGRPPRRVSLAMRGVLRTAARAHGAGGRGTDSFGFRRLEKT